MSRAGSHDGASPDAPLSEAIASREDRSEDAADERERAREAALTLLAARARAHGELGERLKRKGYSPDAVGWACAEMVRLGLLDDSAFSESWVRDRLLLRPKGRRALAAELRAKGVSGEVAAGAIERVMADEAVDERTLCLAAAEKWMRTQGARVADRKVRERRLAGFLARRGFGGGVVRQALIRVNADAS